MPFPNFLHLLDLVLGEDRRACAVVGAIKNALKEALLPVRQVLGADHARHLAEHGADGDGGAQTASFSSSFSSSRSERWRSCCFSVGDCTLTHTSWPVAMHSI